MGNMSYCRFQNTASDLSDCYFNMGESHMSDQELIARKQLVKLCIEIARDYAEIAEEEIDFEQAQRDRNTPPWGDEEDEQVERSDYGRNKNL